MCVCVCVCVCAHGVVNKTIASYKYPRRVELMRLLYSIMYMCIISLTIISTDTIHASEHAPSVELCSRLLTQQIH